MELTSPREKEKPYVRYSTELLPAFSQFPEPEKTSSSATERTARCTPICRKFLSPPEKLFPPNKPSVYCKPTRTKTKLSPTSKSGKSVGAELQNKIQHSGFISSGCAIILSGSAHLIWY